MYDRECDALRCSVQACVWMCKWLNCTLSAHQDWKRALYRPFRIEWLYCHCTATTEFSVSLWVLHLMYKHCNSIFKQIWHICITYKVYKWSITCTETKIFTVFSHPREEWPSQRSMYPLGNAPYGVFRLIPITSCFTWSIWHRYLQ